MAFDVSGTLGVKYTDVFTPSTDTPELPGPSFAVGQRSEGSDGTRWVWILAAEALDQYDAVAANEDWSASQLTTTEAEDGWKVGVVPVAIASGSYGWMQVRGPCIVNVLAVSADTVLSTSASAGALDDLTTGATRIQGIVALVANTITTKTAVAGFMAVEPFADLPVLA